MLARLAELLAKYPPQANDYLILLRLRALGIEPGKSFDATNLDPVTIAMIDKAAKDTLADMAVAMTKMGDKVNGWNIRRDNLGTFGTWYLRRAVIAFGALGANLVEDAVYPTAFVDGKGPTGEWREQIRAAFRARQDSAGGRLLVDHHVR
jgi:hypothetical protein